MYVKVPIRVGAVAPEKAFVAMTGYRESSVFKHHRTLTFAVGEQPRTERRLSTEAVSKLEIPRFLGVALPLPMCHEADTEHSGGATSR
jgi:hypothetical protein